ncbi:hypothetical protein GX563_05050 [Candidatus Bathyarchaeota archaeon]|nr:hypothetical protein [Candidatus Bathyarchaeota archaeon]
MLKAIQILLLTLNKSIFNAFNIIKAKFSVFLSPEKPELYIKNALLQTSNKQHQPKYTFLAKLNTLLAANTSSKKHLYISTSHVITWKKTVTSPKKRDLSPKSLDITTCDSAVTQPFTIEDIWRML